MKLGLELTIPPPVVALVFGAAMWLLADTFSAISAAFPYRSILSFAFATLGVAIALLGVGSFRRARTTVNPLKPDTTSSLVTSGIYRYTRNPMYLGMALALVGWAVFLGNALTLIFVAGFMLYMNRFQIAPEERVLASLFGTEFAAYQRKVRRWL